MRFAMRDFRQQKFIPLRTKLLQLIALWLWAPFGLAQNNLGEVLDAGGKVLSAEEFRRETIQRVITGPMPSGGSLEIIYLTNGTIQGVGRHPLLSFSQPNAQIFGQWTTDDKDRVCTSMRIGEVPLPARCQFWFKYDEQYYLSDSDSDRSAKVLRRTVKQ
jgi:hypothetical protein